MRRSRELSSLVETVRPTLDETGRRPVPYSSPAPCSPIAAPKAAQISGCTSMGAGRGGGEPILRDPQPRIRPPLIRPHKRGGNLERKGKRRMNGRRLAGNRVRFLFSAPRWLSSPSAL